MSDLNGMRHVVVTAQLDSVQSLQDFSQIIGEGHQHFRASRNVSQIIHSGTQTHTLPAIVITPTVLSG